jgi:NADH-quinone oxidoreductase subunit L
MGAEYILIMKTIIALVPFLPFISFLIIGLTFKRLPKILTNLLACGTVLVSFVFSVILFFYLKNGNPPVKVELFDWLPAANTTLGF